MKLLHTAAAALFAVLFAGAAQADSLPMDQPITMDGIETVCTGIGSAKDDPRWMTYPVRVEFSNGGAQYLAGAHVVLSGGGRTLASFDCIGSWVLFKLPKGSYKVEATLTGQQNGGPRSAPFVTTGEPPQKRVVIQFAHIAPNQ